MANGTSRKPVCVHEYDQFRFSESGSTHYRSLPGQLEFGF